MEKKLRSRKVFPWTTKDYVKNAIVYFLGTVALYLTYICVTHARIIKDDNVFPFSHQDWINSFNFFVLTLFLSSIVFFYFYYEDRNFLKEAKNSIMIFVVTALSLLVILFAESYIGVYIRPFALFPLLILFLTNKKTAIFLNVAFSILVFLFNVFMISAVDMDGVNAFTNEYIYYLVMCIVSGLLAIYLMNSVYSRGKLLLYSLIVSLPSTLCALMPALSIGGVEIVYALVFGLLSGPLAAGFFMLLLPVMEMLFNKASSFKLAELTNHKSPVIARLMEQAPGTFNHAVIVSNLAEACAIAIGEDSLLARTCAYYHDIGKLRRPEYFKENQGEEDLHKDLTPELSANIIKSHAEDGYKLALKNRIPLEVANVAREHHGTMPIIYFYEKAKKFTDGEVPYQNFCYPGPKPQSKMSAILMIADGCEAAARTLTDRSKEKVEKVVDSIITQRMNLGQFDDCEITLKELDILKETIIDSLTGVYHKRTAYPKLRVNKEALYQEKPQKNETDKK